MSSGLVLILHQKWPLKNIILRQLYYGIVVCIGESSEEHFWRPTESNTPSYFSNLPKYQAPPTILSRTRLLKGI